MSVKMEVVAVHGDRDKAKVHKAHLERQIRDGVPEAKRAPGPDQSDVTVVLSGGGSSLELHVKDWDEAAKFEDGQSYQVTLTRV